MKRIHSSFIASRANDGEWQTREGETRVSYDVWADDVINLSPRDEASNGQGPAPAPVGAAATGSRAPSTAATESEDLDDLPF